MGIGGAMIMPTSMAIIGWVFPPERRAGAIAAWSASAGIGVAVGPVLGGLLIDHFWWGSVFLINLPIVAIGLIGAALVVPNPHSPQRRQLDPLGLSLSTFGLLGVTYGLIEGGQAGGWDRWQVWGSIAAGVLLIAAFLFSQLKEKMPSFDPRLFRNPRFAAGNVGMAALFLTLTGQSFYMTFYLQGARGLSALHAGLLSLPAAAGVVVGSALGARLARRFSIAAVSGTALVVFAACHAFNLLYGIDTPLVYLCLVGSLSGLAVGTAVAPTSAAILSTLPMDRMGAGSAVNNAIRQVGSVLGIAVLGTIVSNVYQHSIASSLAGLPAAARDAASGSAEATRRTAGAVGRPELVGQANDAFVHSMHVAASVAAAFALLGAIAVILAFRAKATPAQAPEAPEPAEVPTVVG
jgi:EmrB/QacA subfamily drug resistance transporter